ncbi:iron reductase [Actinomadura craniellae]|uniref:Iron reductase n=1 Tax=Actinomadura craniellae TaxID=2231787 RepID=A0A365H4R9_9ACTN|nr:(2Fe-2S)-binding protein [Actinomadura craniellae]RAY14091.1 iron reductase [Actinomadura craniellae]
MNPEPCDLAAGEGAGLRPAGPDQVVAALADVTAISAYFEIGHGPAGPGWRPFTDLFAGALGDRVAVVAERLGTAETRVAASILFQGLAARLWSPALGPAVAHGLLPDLDPARLYWRPVDSGPLPLRTPHPAGWITDDPDRAAAFLYENVVEGLLEPLVRAVRQIVGLAPGLLWGNAASALAGTVGSIGRERPALAGPAVSLGRALLGQGVLAGTGTGDLVEPSPGGPFFLRRSCCLYYRLPGGGKCGDCALVAPGTRRAPGGGTG